MIRGYQSDTLEVEIASTSWATDLLTKGSELSSLRVEKLSRTFFLVA